MELIEQLKRDEGLRLVVYDDATKKPIGPGSVVVGHPTIGYGRALDVRGITKEEAEYLLANDRSEVEIELTSRIPWITSLTPPRQSVLYSMAFNMGIDGLMKFENTLAFIKVGSYGLAATEMLDSQWAKQVGDRAIRLSQQMMDGQWH